MKVRAACAAPLLALASVCVWAACSPERVEPEPVAGPPPDVVLLVLDTLRRDHLPCYGYERPNAPKLDALCAISTVYDDVRTTSPWTLPSHASLFTGLHPITHRAHHENRVLDAGAETLAEILSAVGYETVALVANAMLNRDRQLDQGFERYVEAWRKTYDAHPRLFPDHRDERPMPWDGVEDPLFVAGMKQLRPGVDENAYFEFRRLLRKRDPKRPLFAFVNLVGIHSPYNSSGPFYDRYLRHSGLAIDENRWPQWYAGRWDFPEAQVEHLVDLYDAEILHVDHVVGRMIEDLKASGRFDRTLFIVTSDHGENLGDHGHLSHVFSLHDTLARVPLIVHHPPAFPAGERIGAPTLLVDLFPTILRFAGVDPARYPSDGVELVRDAAEPAGPRTLVLEYYYPTENLRFLETLFDGDVPGIERFERRMRAVVEGELKLIWGSDGAHELYDLGRDPDERENLIDAPAYEVARDRLLESLRRFVESRGGDAPLPRADAETTEPALDPETVEQLEELGYL